MITPFCKEEEEENTKILIEGRSPKIETFRAIKEDFTIILYPRKKITNHSVSQEVNQFSNAVSGS